MPSRTFAVNTTAAVPLAAATPKTVLGVYFLSWYIPNLSGMTVAFDGAAVAVPVLVELCRCSFATNAPGTNSTARTWVQTGGRAEASGPTAASAWTVEPTVLTPIFRYLLTPNAGNLNVAFPNGVDTGPSGEGWAVRCTAPAIVNVRANLRFREM